MTLTPRTIVNESWVTIEQFERVLDAVVGIENVRLTFDDGNASDVEIALPRLLERRLTAEFFLLAGRIGERGRVDADGVRELVKSGMTIGSHGWDHRDWRRLDERHARRELREAPERLAKYAGQPVRRMALPFGAYDRHVLERLRKAGATRVYTNEVGVARGSHWLQPRTSLQYDLDDQWLEDTLRGGPTSLTGLRHQARRAAGRLVKLAHG
jgi:peptidoglycan/xylan/chitin deacetylase (PgdA/CDA1 family)